MKSMKRLGPGRTPTLSTFTLTFKTLLVQVACTHGLRPLLAIIEYQFNCTKTLAAYHAPDLLHELVLNIGGIDLRHAPCFEVWWN